MSDKVTWDDTVFELHSQRVILYRQNVSNGTLAIQPGTGPTERNDQNNNLKAGKNLVAQRRTFCGAGDGLHLVPVFIL